MYNRLIRSQFEKDFDILATVTRKHQFVKISSTKMPETCTRERQLRENNDLNVVSFISKTS